MTQRILVWDLPTRIFHWSLALSFAGAFLTAESDRWADIHVVLGYSMLGLLAFRLIWGFVGSRYARFAEFVRGPGEVLRYARGLAAGRPPHFTGHNPLGAVAILLLIGLGIASGVSGWLLYEGLGGEWLEELHEGLANGMLAVVIVHVLGVLFGSMVHRENLVRAMLTGRKRGESRDAIAGPNTRVGLLLLMVLAGCWFWNGVGARNGWEPRAGSSAPYLTEAPESADRDGE
jgi:cytochrome b